MRIALVSKFMKNAQECNEQIVCRLERKLLPQDTDKSKGLQGMAYIRRTGK